MYLVAGLGNPGREHENDRHNVGFRVVDVLGVGEYRSKFNALMARGSLAGEDVVALKPQTYMNLSGDSVQPAAAFFKIAPAHVIVVHDELDLPWRDVRLKQGGGHAGHNGVRNIIDRLGTPDFVRVRVGIGKPPRLKGEAAHVTAGSGDTRAHVLSGFDAGERADLPGIVDRAAEAVRRVLKDGLAAAMNATNTKG